MNKISSIKFLLLISILFQFFYINSANSQQTYQVGKKTTAESAADIVTKELIKIGLKRLNELIKLAKNNKGAELSNQFASTQAQMNLQNTDDKVAYAMPTPAPEDDEELIAERVDFFKSISKDCGKMKKIYVGYMSSEDEPIGHAFRLTIPAKLKKGDFSCYHYTVSFRRTIEGKLLVTEWYDMPGNADCQ